MSTATETLPAALTQAIDDYGVVCANVVKGRTEPECENIARDRLEAAILAFRDEAVVEGERREAAAARVPVPDGPQGWPVTRAVVIAVSAFTSNTVAVLRRVQNGERIALTQRGKPVAVLCPVERGSDA